MTTYNNTLTEQVGLDDATLWQLFMYLSDTLGIDDTQVTEAIFGLLETIGVTDVLDTLLTGQINVADGIGFQDAFEFFIDLVITDQIGLQETPAAYKANVGLIADVFAIQDIAVTKLTALNALASIIGLIETLERGLQAAILDKLGLSEDLLTKLKAAGLTSETMGLLESSSYTVSIFLEVDDTLAVEDDILFGQKVQALIEEGISFAVTLIGPHGDTYTGWVMNSENMAVTTYENYDFTDMARINGQYYGVRPDGLFLLRGSDDDGAFIEAIIRSAKMELGTSNLKNISAAYLGFRADGNPVIKIVTNESEETWYNVQESRTDLHTAHIRLGKGQIGRYWQFELITRDSTQLELDSVELVPMILKRKI